MPTQPQAHSWFAPSPLNTGFGESDDPVKSPGEFERLWRGFMTARVTLGLMLLLLQGSLWGLGQSANPLLIFVCGGYFAAGSKAKRRPRLVAAKMTLMWVSSAKTWVTT